MTRRASPYRLTELREPEHAIQKRIAGVLRMEIGLEAHISPHGVTWFSIDHAGPQPYTRAGRGVPAGIWDMLVLYQGRAFWVELKSRDGMVSDPQRSMAATLLLSGCRIAVACDEGDVLRALDEWQIPRSHRVKLQQVAA